MLKTPNEVTSDVSVSQLNSIQVPENSIEQINSSSGENANVNVAVEEERLGFTILQCKSCRSIIGDTSSLLIFNRETLFITLQKKSDNVAIDGELETSKGEFDYGSTFNNLHCKNCNEWIGRTYRTTTPELDHIRGRFSFNLESLIMFELNEVEPTTIVTDDQNLSRGVSGVDKVEIIKLQKFVLALYDRLEKLEAENEMLKLKSELLSISKKIDNNSDDTFKSFIGSGSGIMPKQTKIRKVRTQRDSETQTQIQDTQLPTKTFEPIKTIAASINSTDFLTMTSNEQLQILNNLDEESALEIISWSILKNGRVSQIQREIDF